MAATLFAPLALAASPVVVDIVDYAAWAGQRTVYFDGRLLTSGDLGGDQQYLAGTRRQLGDPGQVLGDPSLTLGDLFTADGRASVRLSFDCAVVDCHVFSEPTVVGDPHHDDLIFLDVATGTWFGELYLAGIDGVAPGVYRTLSGSFDRVSSVPEPSGAALVAVALAGLIGLSRRPLRRHRRGLAQASPLAGAARSDNVAW